MSITRYPIAGGSSPVESVNGETGAVTLTASDVGAQASDADLTAIAGLTHANDTILQTKSGAWAARTIAQVKADLAITPIVFLTQTEYDGLTPAAGTLYIIVTG